MLLFIHHQLLFARRFAMDNFKLTRGSVIAFWVFAALVVGSLVCVHYSIASGQYFVYAMPVPFIFAAICEVTALRRRNKERRKYSRAP